MWSEQLGARPGHPTEQHGHGPWKPITPTHHGCDLGQGQREKGPTQRRQVAASRAGHQGDEWQKHTGQESGVQEGPE